MARDKEQKLSERLEELWHAHGELGYLQKPDEDYLLKAAEKVKKMEERLARLSAEKELLEETLDNKDPWLLSEWYEDGTLVPDEDE